MKETIAKDALAVTIRISPALRPTMVRAILMFLSL